MHHTIADNLDLIGQPRIHANINLGRPTVGGAPKVFAEVEEVDRPPTAQRAAGSRAKAGSTISCLFIDPTTFIF